MRCNDYVCNYLILRNTVLLYLLVAVVYFNFAYSSTFLIGGGGGGGSGGGGGGCGGGGGGCCCGGGGGGGGGGAGGCARCLPLCLAFCAFFHLSFFHGSGMHECHVFAHDVAYTRWKLGKVSCQKINYCTSLGEHDACKVVSQTAETFSFNFVDLKDIM